MPLKSPAPLPKPSMNAGIVAALIVASLTILFSAWYLSGDTKALTTREGTQVSSEAHAKALPPPVENAPALNRPGSSSTQPTLILGIEPNAANQGQLLRMLQKKIAASTPVEEIRALLESIAMSDPALAVDLALGIARTDAQKTVFVSGVLQGWVRKDPEAAWRWTLHESRRLDSPDEPTFLSVTLDYLSEMQPHMVVSAVEAALQPGGKPDSLDARQLTQTAVQAMIRSRHTKMACWAVERWAGSLSAQQIDRTTFKELAMQLANDSPANAADWLQSLPACAGRNAAVVDFASEWAQRSPEPALEWTTTLEQNDNRSEAMQNAFKQWMAKDLAAAGQWLGDYVGSQREPDVAADRMIGHLIRDTSLAHTNPTVALEWAEWILEPSLRAQTIEDTVMDWGRRDPTAAKRSLSGHPRIENEEKEKILQALHNVEEESRNNAALSSRE